MEKKIEFISEKLRLEGRYAEGSTGHGVIITHPHPLYGGDMYNGVVESIASAYRKKGYSTLRFNFRGVGASEGRFDHGQGEQKDVVAAHAHLEHAGIQRVDLAGYSFGAWVNARAGCAGSADQHMVMVSPPVAFIDYSSVGRLPCLKLVVAGSRDDFAPTDQIRNLLPDWNDDAVLKVIEGADHFYSGYQKELESILEAAI